MLQKDDLPGLHFEISHWKRRSPGCRNVEWATVFLLSSIKHQTARAESTTLEGPLKSMDMIIESTDGDISE